MDQALSDISSGAASSVRIERDDLDGKLKFSIDRAQRSLIEQQHAEGYWHAALEANAQMNAEYIIFMHFMETVDKELEERLKKVLLEAQNADGSWSIFPGGEGYLSTSIESYFALKLCGMRAGDEPMMQARRWILSKGGIEKCGTLARFYLACMGQTPWDATASLPVEISLFPNWFFFNMYELASWARGTAFGLMLLQVAKPVVPVDYRDGVLELYIQPPHFTKFKQPPPPRFFSLRTLFNFTDAMLRIYDRHHFKSLRARAVRHAENWILDRQEANGSWGGIEPCYLLSTMALKGLGYRNEHPVVKKGLEATRELIARSSCPAFHPTGIPRWRPRRCSIRVLAASIPRSSSRPDGSSIIRSSKRATGR
jgi:squalene-hopene/tetraprenyl-beta-curcumene cyclase